MGVRSRYLIKFNRSNQVNLAAAARRRVHFGAGDARVGARVAARLDTLSKHLVVIVQSALGRADSKSARVNLLTAAHRRILVTLRWHITRTGLPLGLQLSLGLLSWVRLRTRPFYLGVFVSLR